MSRISELFLIVISSFLSGCYDPPTSRSEGNRDQEFVCSAYYMEFRESKRNRDVYFALRYQELCGIYMTNTMKQYESILRGIND